MSNGVVEFRKKVYEHMRDINSVDKLMRDKIEPFIILDGITMSYTSRQ